MFKPINCSQPSFRADRVLFGAAVSAILIAVCASPSYARHHNNNPNNTATETTMTVNPNGNVQTTVTTASVGIDYSVLSDPDLNYFDIRRAQAYGMNDYQIAQAAKLSHYSMVSMDRILNQIEDGRTIADLAMRYGVPLNDLDDVSGWQNRVHDYMDAWHHTGYGALRNGPAPESVASYSSNTGNTINMNPTTGTTSTYNSTSEYNSTTVTPGTSGTLNNGAVNGTLNNQSATPGVGGTEPGTVTPGTTGTDTGTINNGATNGTGTTGSTGTTGAAQ